MSIFLSVIIPAYNEEERIGSTLQSVDGYLKKQIYDYEILVVSDGSKDKTAEVVRGLSEQIGHLHLIDNTDNHGKGWVVRQGMLRAQGQIRLFMDADNSTTVDQIAGFLPYFEQGYDIVIGSRRIKGAVIAARQPWMRDFLGGVFRLIVHSIISMGVKDSQAGFKVFTQRAAEAIFSQQTIARWAFDVEILALARRMHFKVKEVPIVWVNDIKSHVKLGGMIKMLGEVLQVRKNLWQSKYARQIRE